MLVESEAFIERHGLVFRSDVANTAGPNATLFPLDSASYITAVQACSCREG